MGGSDAGSGVVGRRGAAGERRFDVGSGALCSRRTLGGSVEGCYDRVGVGGYRVCVGADRSGGVGSAGGVVAR